MKLKYGHLELDGTAEELSEFVKNSKELFMPRVVYSGEPGEIKVLEKV